MSTESLAIALNHSRATGAAKLVLIGIANHDGDGGAWPSVRTLARYAGVDPRSVQRAVDKLERLGEVRRIVQGGGLHSMAEHERPNLYKFLLQCPPSCDRSKNHRTPHFNGPVLFGDDPLTPASPPDVGVTPPPDTSVTGPPDVGVTRTTHLTNNPLKDTRPSTGARVEVETCPHGHVIIDHTPAGTPFCAVGCAPMEVAS